MNEFVDTAGDFEKQEKLAAMAQLRVCAPWMRHELRRFKISDRPRTLAQLILSLSWEEGIPTVRVPKLEFFTQLTGLSTSHVSTALAELQLMRVLNVEETPTGKAYGLNPRSSTWQATPRQSRQVVDEAVNLLREINGIKSARSGVVNFKIGPVNLFLHPELTNSVRPTNSGNEKAEVAA